MIFKKILLNLLVFSILIGSFVYVYIKFDNTAVASELIFCIKNDYTNYITLDSDYTCPAGYFPAPSDFNLNLLVQATSTPNLNDIYNPASTTPSASTTPPNNNYNNATGTIKHNTGYYDTSGTFHPDYPGGTFEDNTPGYYDQNGVFHPYVINNNNSYNSNTGVVNKNPHGDKGYYDANGVYYPYGIPGKNNYGVDGYYDADNNFHTNEYANGTYVNGMNGYYDINGIFHPYDLSKVPNNGVNTGRPPVNKNPYGEAGFYDINGRFYTYLQDDNGNSNNNGDIFAVNNNPIIQVDETLAHGRFESLDPRDYKYCVLLNHNMTIGMNDNNTEREVSALQSYLYDRGFLNMTPDGNYDANTALAVKRFQYLNQIEVSGIVKVDLRNLLQELTCVKYPVITYKAKPISPTPITVKVTTTNNLPETNKTSTPKTTTTPKQTSKTEPKAEENKEETTKVVIIPKTDLEDNKDTNIISPLEGNMYLSSRNRLYFIYKNSSQSPYICLSLNNSDCTNSDNYKALTEGVETGLYEAVNFSNYWTFNLYNGLVWGNPGDKVRIYLRANKDKDESSLYVVNVLN